MSPPLSYTQSAQTRTRALSSMPSWLHLVKISSHDAPGICARTGAIRPVSVWHAAMTATPCKHTHTHTHRQHVDLCCNMHDDTRRGVYLCSKVRW